MFESGRISERRHTAATVLLSSGLDVVTVAEQLGDRPATVMATYAHVQPASRQLAADILAAQLG